MFDFAEILEQWFAAHGRRDLPWRGISDPYRIWISEIILQQTRVVQGMDYYFRFIERFPDVAALAAAEEDEVLKLWQGLGYYSRARNLHAAAKSIVALGHFPTDYAGVRALKGVGDYTAAAICSFAYQQPYPVVDGNVYRVLSRIYGITTPIDSTEGKKQFAQLAQQLLDREHPDIYNSAIMDFGALQCTPQQPDCMFCPFAEFCEARSHDWVQDLPVKAKKLVVKDRFFVYIYIETADAHVLLHRRPEGDIWQGLYEPYLLEFPKRPSEQEVLERFYEELQNFQCRQLHDRNSSTSSLESAGTLVPVVKGVRHILTHRRLFIDLYRIPVSEVSGIQDVFPADEGYSLVSAAELDGFAFPKVLVDLLAAMR